MPRILTSICLCASLWLLSCCSAPTKPQISEQKQATKSKRQDPTANKRDVDETGANEALKRDDANAEDKKANDAAAGPSGLQLILVRHAEAFWNLPDWQSVPDSRLDSLTPRGIKQADAVGKALKESGVQVATVLTAPTGRAGQTAALLMKALGLQGKPVTDPAVNACQAGETSADKSARIMGAIAKLEQRYTGKTVVIVTHQHLIHCVLDRAAQNEQDGTGKFFECPPGSMTVLHISKDAWKIEKKPEVIGP